MCIRFVVVEIVRNELEVAHMCIHVKIFWPGLVWARSERRCFVSISASAAASHLDLFTTHFT